ncbi:MAG TPA: hypothetical protein VJ372_17020 [Pyrinomonadaceae bacterium]|jgi:hypothetical protein|nr:hypothetical protein [Pyrinomonadaceae bacterium]
MRAATSFEGSRRGHLFRHLATRLRQRIPPVVGLSKPLGYFSNHRKILRRITAIFSLATTALVGVASIGNSTDVPITTSATTQTEIIGDFGFSLRPSEPSTTTLPSLKAKKPLAAIRPESTPSSTPASAIKVPQQVNTEPELRATSKEFVEVAVVLKIEDGHVTEARVGNRQPGAEAFERTALHLARQRRYPPGTSRTETFVIRVVNQLGRKQP